MKFIKSKFHENKDWNPASVANTITASANIKSKFHENKDWNRCLTNAVFGFQCIKSKFHENKDWNLGMLLQPTYQMFIKSKFHENKDWNPEYPVTLICTIYSSRASSTKTRIETLLFTWWDRGRDKKHQEQVPRKQGLKPSSPTTGSIRDFHQEQVPRKQGLKHQNGQSIAAKGYPSRASSTKTRIETHSTICR